MRRLLRPTNDYAPDAILPGDPQVALELAQALIEGPLMANHARGLWGYTGPEKEAPERSLSIQSTGYGGQSAAAVLVQLAGLGVERAVRVGTCVATDPALGVGHHVIVRSAVGHDGGARVGSDELTERLATTHPGPLASGAVASVDTIVNAELLAPEAIVVDGATAGLFAGADAAGVPTAAALVIVESGRVELDDESARAELVELGRIAALALADAGSQTPEDVGHVKHP